jgi:hypothetical protein
MPVVLRGGIVQVGLHKCFMFADTPTGRRPQGLPGRKPRGFVKPASEIRAVTQAAGLLGEKDENRLGYILRFMRIAGVTQSD